MDNCPQTSLALDDDVGDTHLAAESREEDNEFDGVDVVGDDDEGSLLGLDESDDVVQAILDEERLSGLDLLAISDGGSGGLETGLLLLKRLGAVLVEELEELSRGVLVESVGELGDGGGNLETLVKDNLLALELDVFGPLDEAGQVGLGLDVLACGMIRKKSWKMTTGVPMAKLRGLASKRGFFLTLEVLLAPKGAAATFFPVLAVGGWSSRQSQHLKTSKFQCRLGALAFSVSRHLNPAQERHCPKRALHP